MIVEYEEKYLEDVRDLLVELEDLNPFLSLQVQVLKLKRDF